MDNTNAQYDAMQEMVNKLVAANVKPVTPAHTPTPATASTENKPTTTTAPTAPKPVVVKASVPAEPTSRPEMKDFYSKTWVALSSDKKFPISEKDLRINLANELYASLKDVFWHNEPFTKKMLKDIIPDDHEITIGYRTDKVVAKIQELGFVGTLDIQGILNIGEQEAW